MEAFDAQRLYVDGIWGLLFLIGVWHILAGPMTERVFREIRNVRLAGIALVLMALPCVAWPRPYFIAVGIILLLSGLLRAVTPGFNVQLEKTALPRWGHGLVIVSAAVIGWAAYEFNWIAH